MSKRRVDEESMNDIVTNIYVDNNFEEDDLLGLSLMCLIHWSGDKSGTVGRIQKQLQAVIKEREGTP